MTARPPVEPPPGYDVLDELRSQVLMFVQLAQVARAMTDLPAGVGDQVDDGLSALHAETDPGPVGPVSVATLVARVVDEPAPRLDPEVVRCLLDARPRLREAASDHPGVRRDLGPGEDHLFTRPALDTGPRTPEPR